MKKKLLAGVLCLCIAAAILPSGSIEVKAEKDEIVTMASDELYYGDYTYKILDEDEGTIVITDYVGKDEDLVIPQTISGYRVTKIGKSAFADSQSLKMVKLPEGLTEIEGITDSVLISGAFENCKNLSEIELPMGLTRIGYRAFKDCGSLKEIKLPEGLSMIEGRVFENCTGLKNIIIPSGVTMIGPNAFNGCSSLKKAELPQEVTVIDAYAFNNCKKLTDIEIPSGVTEIGFYAFSGCTSLKKITLPEDLTEIPTGMFLKCSSLETIQIPSGVTEIKTAAFEKCTALKRVIISSDSKLVKMNEDCFSDCSNLERIDLPSVIDTISNSAFADCKKLVAGVYNNSYGVKYVKEKKMKYFLLDGPAVEGWTVTLSQTSYSYNGTAREPAVTVKKNGTALTRGTDYEVFYDNNIQAGTAKVTVIALGNWNGIFEYPFEIVSNGNSGNGGADGPFSDVNKADWFWNAVDYVNENKLMTGLGEGVFGPLQSLARAQFAVILHRMNGKPKMTYIQKFLDVSAGAWFTDAVLWANNAGVVSGYTSGNFGPSDNINREQMAVMMYRYAKFKKYEVGEKAEISKFQDHNLVSDFAEDAMQWAFGNGIITGKDNGTRLDPQGYATRAECAAIIMRFVKKYK